MTHLEIVTRDTIVELTNGAASSFSMKLAETSIKYGKPAYFSVAPYHQALFVSAAEEANLGGITTAITYIRGYALAAKSDSINLIVDFLGTLRPGNVQGQEELGSYLKVFTNSVKIETVAA